MANQRFIVLTFFLAGVLVGFTVRGLGLPLLASLEIADPLVLGLVNASSLVSLACGLLTFFFMLKNERAYSFTAESIYELRKTSWPGKEETVRSTAVVIGTTFFIAAALASYDLVWAKLTGIFLFTES